MSTARQESNACMTTSWDDGHPLDLRLADLLSENGLRATFYIPRVSQTRTMPAEQIRELAARFDIGAHTMRHTFLDTATDLVAEREIIESKAWVEEVTGRSCEMFCPPAGKFAERDLRFVRQGGYTGIRTVELMSTEWPREKGGVQVMPTTVHAFPHSAPAYLKNAIKRGAPQNFWRYITHGKLGEWDAVVRPLLDRVAADGGVFHLWGHSWELDEQGQWQRLAAVLKIMAEYADRLPCYTNAEVCHARRTAPAAAGALN